MRKVVVDPFCYRVFGQIIPCTVQFFTEQINLVFSQNDLKPGYAPFCKHLFVPNFTQATLGTLQILPQNQHLLRSTYQARQESELAVLVRWFPKESLTDIQVADYLDVILYSFQQIQLQNASMGKQDPNSDYQWGVVSIKPQKDQFEYPMTPITMLRNALGMQYGGSGVGFTKEEYQKSVDFWNTHALIKQQIKQGKINEEYIILLI